MSRLSRAQAERHEEAVALLTKQWLTEDEREFVLENWQESANHINSAAAAFFTPSELAHDAAIFAQGDKVIDLCAGIGGLGLWVWWQSMRRAEVTCIEVNPAYVEVGRKLFPEARWICASVEEVLNLGERFDVAVSNPPFGKRAKIKGPRYSGEDDLAVVDIASEVADFGTFILPTMSVPFRFSGQDWHELRPSPKYDRFHAATGIDLKCEPVDCAYYAGDWRGVKPKVELASAEFIDLRATRLPAPQEPVGLGLDLAA